MLKVLLLGNAELGIYAFRRELIIGLMNRKFQVVVGFPFSSSPQKIQALGCQIEHTDIHRHGTNVIEDGKLLMRYIQLIQEHTPCVVLTFTVKPNVYASIACQLCGVPYINNITGMGAALQRHTFLSRFVSFLQKLAYRKSSCVFFQNQANSAMFFRLGIIQEKTPTYLLPGSGVNLSLNGEEPFPINDGIFRFVTIARIQREKGYDLFLPVAERIKKKYPNVEFHIVGWFEEETFKNEVERLAREKIIVYHGELTPEEVHCLIARCNCLVHPTYHEGMSNVCLEAAATGRPIIASDIPGCRETFDDGISGYGFKVKDEDALYEVLERFIHTPIEKQAEMGHQGRLKMEKEFDRQIVVNAYLEEIEKIIRKAS